MPTERNAEISKHCTKPTGVALEGSRMRYTEREYADHWGDFLTRYKWSLFATLTTRYPIQEERLVLEHLKWIRRLEREAQGAAGWMRCIEHHACGRHLHIHCLVWVPPCVIPSTARGLWKHLGKAHVERYDPAKGAAYYVGKTYKARHDSIDLSRRMPPRIDDDEL